MAVKILTNNKGLSLIELMVVIVLIGIILSTIIFMAKGAILNMGTEAVISELALAIYKARQEAVSGNPDPSKRTFDLNQPLIKPYSPIKITAIPVLGTNTCKSICEDQLNSICVSGNNFCFTPSEKFTFERSSGRLTNPHALFVTSNKRIMAILITTSGNYFVAELINNTWKTQRELKQLLPKQDNKQPTDVGDVGQIK